MEMYKENDGAFVEAKNPVCIRVTCLYGTVSRRLSKVLVRQSSLRGIAFS